MLTYFGLGVVSGILLTLVFVTGKMLAYRREVLILKKSLADTQALNADLQHNQQSQQSQSYE
jgi:hypothetical protein